jgi:hypothetical protein
MHDYPLYTYPLIANKSVVSCSIKGVYSEFALYGGISVKSN